MSIIVIHSTKYGSTEKYAIRIAKRLQCPVVKSEKVQLEDLVNYNIIILGSCLLEGQLAESQLYQRWILAYPEKQWIMFTVGLCNPSMTDFTPILKSHFLETVIQNVKFFHYRGTIQYKRLLLMSNLVRRLGQENSQSIDTVKLDEEDQRLLKRYGTSYDGQDVKKTDQLIEWLMSQKEDIKEI